MISLLISDQNKTEKNALKSSTKERFAYYSEDFLEVKSVENDEERQNFIEENGLLDMAYLEIKDENSIDFSKKIRKNYEVTEMMLIAEPTISPMEYMTPEIRAASLLIRPFEQNQMQSVIELYLKNYFQN